MPTLSSDPILSLYALVATLVSLHVLILAQWTAAVRLRNKTYVNAEDATQFKGAPADADLAAVLRVKRAHQNALENAVPFLAIGFFYALSGPSKFGAQAYFFTFLAARVLHSVFYLFGKQPFRTLMFGIGVAAIVGMAIRVIRVTL
jgi:uncharacterized MAPEG superfamily protein